MRDKTIEELWRPIEGYEGFYEVSNYGRCRSLDRIVKCKSGSTKMHKGKILNLETNKLGYKFIHVSKYGKAKRMLVHRIVAKTFLNNPNNYKVVNHKDENPSNNHVDNLEWCTYSYNNQYNELNLRRFKTKSESVDSGRVKLGMPIIQLTLDGQFINEYTNANIASKILNIDPSGIRGCCRGRTKSYKNFIWIDKDKYFKEDK